MRRQLSSPQLYVTNTTECGHQYEGQLSSLQLYVTNSTECGHQYEEAAV